MATVKGLPEVGGDGEKLKVATEPARVLLVQTVRGAEHVAGAVSMEMVEGGALDVRGGGDEPLAVYAPGVWLSARFEDAVRF